LLYNVDFSKLFRASLL